MSATTSRAYFLHSERLGLGTWKADDVDLALGLWGDPAVTRLFGGPFTEAQVRERLAREMATQAEHGVQYWPVFLLDDGAHVGCCGLRPHDEEGCWNSASTCARPTGAWGTARRPPAP